MDQFAHLFNEAECWDAAGWEPAVKQEKKPRKCRSSGSFASPSAIAHIAVQKYVMYSPLYRLEKEYERQGLKLSQQTMSNWLLSASEDWLEPIYDVLHVQALLAAYSARR